MEFTEDTQETEKLKAIIYKIAREKELNEEEKEVIEKIIEDKDYSKDDESGQNTE